MNSVAFRVTNRWGLHARPCFYLAVVSREFFSDWEIIIAHRGTGEEANVSSITDTMLIAAGKGSDVEFFSLMPTEAWSKYVDILSALFYTLDENNVKQNWTAYESLKKIFQDIHKMSGDRDILLNRIKETAKAHHIERFFRELPRSSNILNEQTIRVKSNLDGVDRYDVFISKASEDAVQAKELFYFLERSGIRTFLSDFSIANESDSDFQEVIERALETTRHIIVVGSSAASFTSDWVKAEWRAFLAEKRAGRKPGNLITIRCGSVGIEDLPFALRPFQSLAWNEECFAAILPFLKR